MSRIAALVPEFAVKHPPLGRTLMMMMMIFKMSPDYLDPSKILKFVNIYTNFIFVAIIRVF